MTHRNLFCKARADEFVLGVDDQHLHGRCSQPLGHVQHLCPQIILRRQAQSAQCATFQEDEVDILKNIQLKQKSTKMET